MANEHGATFLSWTFAEYEKYERSQKWYIAAIIIGVLFLIYSIVTRNFLFAVIVVMMAAVLYLRQVREPQKLTCNLTERGVLCADRFLPYDDFQNFWIMDREGQTSTLYIQMRGLRPRVAVPIEDGLKDQVRTILRAHVSENDEKEEPASDVIGRALKL